MEMVNGDGLNVDSNGDGDVVMAMVIIIITVTMEAVWTGWKRRHFCHLTLRSIHHMRISFYLSYFFIYFSLSVFLSAI